MHRGGKETIVQGIDHHTQETPHFRIHYTAGSFAEQHLTLVGERLEHAYRILAALLSVDVHSASIIDVYLSELLADPQQPGVALESLGYAITNTREIHEVYRADAPGHGLERSLLQVLLAIALGHEHPLPPLIMDGLLAYVMQRLDDASPMTELAKAKAQRRLPSVNALLPGPTSETRAIYYPAVASFV